MHKNKWLKKYIKMIIAFRGLKAIEKAANQATYKTVWVAGPVIENIHSIEPVRMVSKRLTEGL
jgi:nitronate monooxygenase